MLPITMASIVAVSHKTVCLIVLIGHLLSFYIMLPITMASIVAVSHKTAGRSGFSQRELLSRDTVYGQPDHTKNRILFLILRSQHEYQIQGRKTFYSTSFKGLACSQFFKYLNNSVILRVIY